jgi:hypothetical protein
MDYRVSFWLTFGFLIFGTILGLCGLWRISPWLVVGYLVIGIGSTIFYLTDNDFVGWKYALLPLLFPHIYWFARLIVSAV